MKTVHAQILVLALAWAAPGAEDLKSRLQVGLFEEEANHNLPAAIAAYRAAAAQFDLDRELAATALFRLGECFRKLEKTNEAAAFYQRIVREFPDNAVLARLSQQNLVALLGPGAANPKPGGGRPLSLIREQLKLTEQQWAMAKKQVEVGTMPANGALKYEREALRLKRELARAESDPARQQELLKQELALVETQLAEVKKRREAGLAEVGEELGVQKDLLALKAEAAAQEEPPPATSLATTEEAAELKRLQTLLKDSPDLINAKSGVGSSAVTPLQNAVLRGQVAVVQFLLEHKADLEVKDGAGKTALILAAANGQKRILELLLDKGAFLEAADKTGATALHAASGRGYRAVAEVLLARKANLNAPDTFDRTPLHLAAGEGFNSVIELLLDHGANLEAQSEGYANPGSSRECWYPPSILGSPLQMAARAGHKATVELLLGRKANPNARNAKGHTVLHYAVAEGAPAMAETLLRGGAEVNAPAQGVNQGWTPLHMAVERGSKEMVELLLTNQADPNLAIASGCDTASSPGYTALMMAASRNRPDLTALLLAHGANPNVQSKNGATPLGLGIRKDGEPLVEMLLAHQAKPDFQENRSLWTPLMSAVEQRLVSLTELLLRAKADPNRQNADGNTALHFLAQGALRGSQYAAPPSFPVRPGLPASTRGLPGEVDDSILVLVKLLLTNHADLNLRNAQGLTPLNLFGVPATPKSKPEEALIGLLHEHGAKDALPDLDPDPSVIRLWRQGLAKGEVVFTKDSLGQNRFTLMDAILAFYNRRTPSDPHMTGSYSPAGAYTPASWWHGSANGFREGYMGFPDLGKIQVQRLVDGKTYRQMPVSLLGASTNLECSQDIALQFGDVVEIPEREHTLSELSVGLTDRQGQQLLECASHLVSVVVKGRRHELKPIPGEGLYLSRALGTPDALAVLVSSSDLSRVQVRRFDPKTGAVERTFTNDVVAFRRSSQPISEDLALRQGDVIGVPETGSPADPLAEAVPPAGAPAR